jgi:hypothetical protein
MSSNPKDDTTGGDGDSTTNNSNMKEEEEETASPEKAGEVYVRASDGKKVRRVKRSFKKKQDSNNGGVADVAQAVVEQQRQAKKQGGTADELLPSTETTALLQGDERTPSEREADSTVRTFSRASSSHLLSLHSIFQVTEAKRNKALEHEGVGHAAFLIRDAVLGLVENPADGGYDPYAHPDQERLNTISVLCRRICSMRRFRAFVNVMVGSLILLTFVEPPNWCRYMIREGEDVDLDYVLRSGRCEEFMASSGIPASNDDGDVTDGSTEEVQFYPNTSTMYLSVYESHVVECVCLICLWTFIWLRVGRDGLSLTRYFRAGAARTVRLMEFSAMTCLTVGLIYDICTTMDKERTFAPYMRILIFITSSRECMREFKTLVMMVRRPTLLKVLCSPSLT